MSSYEEGFNHIMDLQRRIDDLDREIIKPCAIVLSPKAARAIEDYLKSAFEEPTFPIRGQGTTIFGLPVIISNNEKLCDVIVGVSV